MPPAPTSFTAPSGRATGVGVTQGLQLLAGLRRHRSLPARAFRQPAGGGPLPVRALQVLLQLARQHAELVGVGPRKVARFSGVLLPVIQGEAAAVSDRRG